MNSKITFIRYLILYIILIINTSNIFSQNKCGCPGDGVFPNIAFSSLVLTNDGQTEALNGFGNGETVIYDSITFFNGKNIDMKAEILWSSNINPGFGSPGDNMNFSLYSTNTNTSIIRSSQIRITFLESGTNIPIKINASFLISDLDMPPGGRWEKLELFDNNHIAIINDNPTDLLYTINGFKRTIDPQSNDAAPNGDEPQNAVIANYFDVDTFELIWYNKTGDFAGILEMDGNYNCNYMTNPVCLVMDVDNDGILNSIDLDDDNDGILDIVEGSLDDDNDGIINSLDLDSDNDGIPDNIEAQYSFTYLSPSGFDNDNNGVDDIYDSNPLVLVDTDNDGIPDYLDLDSDDDGASDLIESGATLSGVDIDQDGLDDNIDDSLNFFGSVNLGVNNPLLFFPNVDSLGDLDYRETVFICTSTVVDSNLPGNPYISGAIGGDSNLSFNLWRQAPLPSNSAFYNNLDPWDLPNGNIIYGDVPWRSDLPKYTGFAFVDYDGFPLTDSATAPDNTNGNFLVSEGLIALPNFDVSLDMRTFFTYELYSTLHLSLDTNGVPTLTKNNLQMVSYLKRNYQVLVVGSGEYTFNSLLAKNKWVRYALHVSDGDFRYKIFLQWNIDGQGWVNIPASAFHSGTNYSGLQQCPVQSIISNQPPIANDDNATADEDVAVVIDVLLNDSDVEGLDNSSVAIITPVTNGQTSINPLTGEITYQGNQDFNGQDSLQYSVCDIGMPILCDTAWVFIDILPVNDPPIANNDNATTDEDVAVVIDVLLNDSDVEGLDNSSVAIITPVTNGQTSINPLTGEITYQGNQDFNGQDSLQYSVCDNGMPILCDTAWIFIDILPVNDPPIGGNDTLLTLEDITDSVVLLINDVDVDFNLVLTSVSFIQNPNYGTFTYDLFQGYFVYKPDSNYNGIDSSKYVVCDNGMPIYCDTVLILIKIDSVNDKPIANNDNATTDEDVEVVIDVLLNDSDVEGLNNSSLTIITPVTNGQTSINPLTGEITYQGNQDFNGQDSLQYSVCDNGMPILCDTAWVFIDILPVNDPPIANNDNATADEDVAVVIDVLLNDSDVEGLDNSSVAIITPVTNGQTSINPLTGEITYQGNQDFNGQDSLQYSVCDIGMPILCDTAWIFIDILPVNDPPIGGNDTLLTLEDITDSVVLLINDVDVDFNLVLTSVSFIQNPNYGTFTYDLFQGYFVYKPDSNFNGIDSSKYVVCDNGMPIYCDTVLILIKIDSVNDKPIANNDIVTTDEDVAVVINVLLNDSDVEGLDNSSVAIITPVTNGQTSINPLTGEITYQGNQDFNGQDSLQYSVCDNGMPILCDTAWVFIDILPVNDPPIANNDNATTDEDVAVVINVLLNDSDVEGLDNSSVAVITPVTNGQISINPLTGEITYQGNQDFNGQDSLQYSVCDNGMPILCDTAWVFIDVLPINDKPIANNDTFTILEPYMLIDNVIINDTDNENNNISITAILEYPINGFLNINPDGTFNYTPNIGFNGLDSFQYVLCDDGIPNACDTASVLINILKNFPPVAKNNTYSVLEDVNLFANIINDIDLLDSVDYDINNESLKVTSYLINNVLYNAGTFAILPNIGILLINSNGDLFYDNNTDYNGLLPTITYIISDSISYQYDTAQVFINVIPVNDPPIANTDLDTIFEDNQSIIYPIINDYDVDGNLDTFNFIVNNYPSNGLINYINGELTYTPNLNFYGNDFISYSICDSGLPIYCDNAIILINIISVNDPPIANNDNATTDEDIPVIIDVLLNDSDVEGLNNSSVAIITAVTNGQTSINPLTGEITYQGNQDFNGQDSLQYSVCDNGMPVLCDTAWVFIDILPVNDKPLANNDNATTDEDVAVVIDVLLNDSDVEGLDNSSVAIITAVTNGQTSINPLTGEITYQGNQDFNGQDSLQYSVCDIGIPVLCDTAWVFIDILPVNDKPLANNDNATTDEDVPVVIDVLLNDSDVEGLNNSSVAIITPVTNGQTSINPLTGEITYQGNQDFNGQDSLQYSVCDNGMPILCDTAWVFIDILPVNDPPIANDDNATTDEDVEVVINVLLNDSDVEGLNNSSVAIITPVTNGQTSINPLTGEITYQGNQDFNGQDSLQYSVCDIGVPIICDTAWVFIDILPVNDPPIAVNDNATTDEDVAVVIDVLLNDSDVEGLNNSSVAIITPVTNGQTSINPLTGVITYQGNQDFNGQDSLQYSVCDFGIPILCDTAWVFIDVLPINDKPIANDDNVSIDEDVAVVIDVLLNDSDVEGLDNSSVDIITPVTNGQTSINPLTGEITYQGSQDFNGQDSLQYSVCDIGVPIICDTAWVFIDILPVNDPPIAVNDNATTDEDVAVVIDVLLNDSDVEGLNNSSVAIITPVTNGQTSINPLTGEITYQGNQDFNGQDSLQYSVCDFGIPILCDTAWVFIDILPVNDPPIANDDNVSIDEDVAVVIDVLLNDSDVEGLNNSSVAIITPVTNGQTSINPLTGEITYQGNQDFNGQDSLQYSVCDIGMPILCDTAWVFIDILPVNDPPIAVNDNATTDEDVAVVIDVLLNDSDVEGLNNSSVAIITPVTNGQTSINPFTGEITYQGNQDFNGQDSLQYSVCDIGMPIICDTAWVFIDILPVNDPPIAVNDNATTDEDVPVVIDVLLNDSDVEGLNNSSVAIITQVTNGQTSINPLTGEITYQGNQDFNGQDSLQYSVCDIGVPIICDTAWVFIDILPVNDPPIAVNDNATADEDVAVVIDVLLNDSDVEGLDNSSVAIITPVTNGQTSINPLTGEITYQGNQDFNGQDSLQYSVCDNGIPILCDTAWVFIDILPVNDPPIANDDNVSIDEDVPVVIDALLNDSDVEGLDNSSVTIITPVTNGQTSINPLTGEITYQGNQDFNGQDSLQYSVCDIGIPVLCDTAWVYIDILLVNDPPIANDDNVSIDEDEAVVIDVLLNDSDVEGLDNSSVAIITPVTNGQTSINPLTGEITYQGNQDFNGQDSLQYSVCDIGMPILCDTAWVFIDILPVNDPPIANNDNATTDEDVAVVIDVLLNDSDVEGLDNSSVAIITAVTNGQTSINPLTGEITYQGNQDFNGQDSLQYSVCDNGMPIICDTAWVFIDILPVNDPPIANNDNATTDEDVAVVIDVLLNDSDVEGLNNSSVAIITPVTNGQTSINPLTGEITYQGNQDFNGQDSLQYSVCDNGMPILCDTAWVFIDILPVNDPPIAVNDNVTTDEDVAVVIDVLLNDSDVEGLDNSSVAIITPVTNGQTSINPLTGEITYQGNQDFNGQDSLQYSVCDIGIPVLCDTAWVFIEILPVNDPPIANNDNATTDEDIAVVIDVLLNDSDVEVLNNSSVAIITPVTNGQTSINPLTGEITYQGNQDFNGQDSLQYSVCDNGMPILCDTAWVFIDILPVNDTPIANDDNVSIDEDVAVVIDVLLNDSDVEGLDNSSVAIITAVTNGQTSINPLTGEITYQGNQDFNGQDSLQYSVCDIGMPILCDTAWVFIDILPVNDPPIANDDNVSIDEDVAVVIDVLLNDSDVEGLDNSSVAIITPVTNGQTSINPLTGEITYQGNQDFNGQDSLQYSVCDIGMPIICDTAWVFIDILPVNDKPLANNDNATSDEDVAVVIDVLLNDSDVEGLNNSSVAIITPVTNGQTSINPLTGEITYQDNQDFNGQDSLQYSVCDIGMPILCDTAWVFIDILPVNDPPIANDDNVSIDEDVAVVIDVLLNDSDVEGLDNSSVAIITPVTNGQTSINPLTGEITYQGNQDFNGQDSLQYSVCDNGMPILCDSAWVFIDILPVNDPPIAVNDNATTDEDVAVVIDALLNDSDVEGLDNSSVAIITAVTNGQTSINPLTGEITYQGYQDFNGQDSLQYSVCDIGMPIICDTAWVFIDILPVNDKPLANNDNATTDEDVAVVIDVLLNDSDVEGLDNSSVAIITPVTNGQTSINPLTGEITYQGNQDFNGQDSLQYSVCDIGIPVLCDTAWVFIDILPVNDPPIAVNDNATTDEDVAVVIDALLNDSDIEGLDNSSVAIITPVTNGQTSINPLTGEITYQGNQDFNGQDSLQYSVCDIGIPVLCDTAWVFIDILPVNDPPIAVNDNATTDEDDPVIIFPLANDSDIEGLDNNSLQLIITNPNAFYFIDSNTISIYYFPEVNIYGIDSFQYSICDNGSPILCDSAWVYIQINNINDVFYASDDFINVEEDIQININILENDIDVEGLDSTSVTIISPVTNGQTSINPLTGEITYQGYQDFNGQDSLQYSVCDIGMPIICDTAWVFIDILPVNDPPIAVNDNATTDEDVAVVIDVLLNDSDVEVLNNSSVAIITPVTNGQTSINPLTGEITYQGNQDFNGQDSLQYSVCDIGMPILCDTAWVFIDIFPVNDPPIAVNDNATTDEDVAVVIDALLNDSDVEGLDNSSVAIITPVTNGQTSINPLTGEITYQGNQDFNGQDSLQYSVCDFGIPILCDTAWVFIDILPVNDPPIAVNDNATTDEDVAVVIDALLNDSDVEGLDNSSVAIITAVTNGQTSINPLTGEITYQGNQDFNGQDSLQYSVCDIGMPILCDTAWVFIDILPVNDPPLVNNDNATTDEDVAVVIDALLNDSDVEGLNNSSVAIITPVTNGQTSINPITGEITYQGNQDFNGQDSLQYSVCDIGMPILCDTAWVFIDILPVNDPPIANNDNATTDEDVAVVIDVLLNDSDVEGLNNSSVAIITPVTNGQTSINPLTGEITYQGNQDFNGQDSLQYSVCDNGMPILCDTAWVFIDILPVNDKPLANKDNATTDEDVAVVIDALLNDSDVEGLNNSSVAIITPVTNGQTSINPLTGEITYQGNQDFNGQDSLQYSVCDIGIPVLCDTAWVFIDILPVNDPPIANDDNVSIDEDVPVVIDALLNDSDVEGLNNSSVAIITAVTNGQTSINPLTGEITYQGNQDFNGQDSLQYSVCDFGIPILCDTAWVFIDVLPINDKPIANDDFDTIFENSNSNINIILNDFDDNAIDTNSITIIDNPNYGNAILNTNGTIFYTPNNNFIGNDTLFYIVLDEGTPNLIDTAMVIITVLPLIDTIKFDIIYNQSITYCFDLPYDIENISICYIPQNGNLSISQNCFTYNPSPNIYGIDESCIITCNDGLCDTNIIIINNINCNFISEDTIKITLDDCENPEICLPLNPQDISEIRENNTLIDFDGCNPEEYARYTLVGGLLENVNQSVGFTVNSWITPFGVFSNSTTMYSLIELLIWLDDIDPNSNWKIENLLIIGKNPYYNMQDYGNLHITSGFAQEILGNNVFNYAFKGTSIELGIGYHSLLITSAYGCVDQLVVEVVCPPVISCNDTTLYLNEVGDLNIINISDFYSVINQSQVQSEIISQNNFNCSNIGINTVQINVVDQLNNSATCNFDINVIDNISPIAICDNINLLIDENGIDSIDIQLIDLGSYDNCGIDTMYLSLYELNCNNIGLNNIILFVDDNYGNSSSCISQINVIDASNPTSNCEQLILTENIIDPLCIWTVKDYRDELKIEDYCGNDFTITQFPDSGTIIDLNSNVNNKTIVFQIEDEYGNTSTCNTTINISCDPEYYINQFFSPNGDGINDFWDLSNVLSNFTNYTISIYNRFGDLVYEKAEYLNEWEGDFNFQNPRTRNGYIDDGNLSEGTYYYVVYFEDFDKIITGFVEIVR